MRSIPPERLLEISCETLDYGVKRFGDIVCGVILCPGCAHGTSHVSFSFFNRFAMPHRNRERVARHINNR